MKLDQLWENGPIFRQSDAVFKIGTDVVKLAEFTNLSRVRRVLDLGCGTGVLGILLGHRCPELILDALDQNPQAVNLTRENAVRNGLSVSAHCLSVRNIRRFPQSFPAGTYDLIVSNPPYFSDGAGFRAKTEPIAAARAETDTTLFMWLEACSYLLRWGGRLSLCYRAERLSELFCAMTAVGIEPKRLKLLGTPPSIALVEGRRGGKTGLLINI